MSSLVIYSPWNRWFALIVWMPFRHSHYSDDVSLFFSFVFIEVTGELQGISFHGAFWFWLNCQWSQFPLHIFKIQFYDQQAKRERKKKLSCFTADPKTKVTQKSTHRWLRWVWGLLFWNLVHPDSRRENSRLQLWWFFLVFLISSQLRADSWLSSVPVWTLKTIFEVVSQWVATVRNWLVIQNCQKIWWYFKWSKFGPVF